MLPKVEKVQGWTAKAAGAARETDMAKDQGALMPLPAWLPEALRHYLRHTAAGMSFRAIARAEAAPHPP